MSDPLDDLADAAKKKRPARATGKQSAYADAGRALGLLHKNRRTPVATKAGQKFFAYVLLALALVSCLICSGMLQLLGLLPASKTAVRPAENPATLQASNVVYDGPLGEIVNKGPKVTPVDGKLSNGVPTRSWIYAANDVVLIAVPDDRDLSFGRYGRPWRALYSYNLKLDVIPADEARRRMGFPAFAERSRVEPGKQRP